MNKVKCKKNYKEFFIKDRWYKVSSIKNNDDNKIDIIGNYMGEKYVYINNGLAYSLN